MHECEWYYSTTHTWVWVVYTSHTWVWMVYTSHTHGWIWCHGTSTTHKSVGNTEHMVIQYVILLAPGSGMETVVSNSAVIYSPPEIYHV